MRYVDIEGTAVRPGGAAELLMIRNTLPKEARVYVRLDKNGLIDRELLAAFNGQSINYLICKKDEVVIS